MVDPLDPDQRKDLEARLIRRAWEDDQFRQLLLKDPRRAIESELGQPLPDSLKIRVLEEDPDTLYLVLPPNPLPLPTRDLTDADLDLVAGGSLFTVMGPNRLSVCLICR
ncbi:MAG: NHLP leader peptide family RiPP precursor [Thermostichus sp. BF3_bins_97]